MKTMKIGSMVAVGALAIVAVAGCDRDRERANADHGPSTPTLNHDNVNNGNVGTTTVTNATANVANQMAVGKIVAARCARESACNNVGVDKHYTNPQACTQKIGADMKDDLNAKDCPAGIDQKELGECLEAIRTEQCNNPIDSISRIAACRTSDLCLKTGATNH